MATRVYRPAFSESSERDASGARRRGYDLIVSGVSDESSVYTAVDSVTPTILVPAVRSILNGNERVEAVTISERLGPQCWRVRVSTQASVSDDSGGTFEEALEWRWEPSAITQETDTDLNGKPYLNSAGVPLDGTISLGKPSLFLRVWQRFDYFDVTLAYNVLWRINSLPVLVERRYAFAAGQMQCQMFQPVGNQSPNQTSVKVEMLFEFRPGYKPFQPRALDQSYSGWTGSPEKRGQFVYLTATPPYPPVDEPVMLDGTGAPFATTEVYVAKDSGGNTAGVGVANPTSLTYGPAVLQPDGSYTLTPPTGDQYIEIDVDNPDNATRLIYAGYNTFDFTGFLPGIVE